MKTAHEGPNLNFPLAQPCHRRIVVLHLDGAGHGATT